MYTSNIFLTVLATVPTFVTANLPTLEPITTVVMTKSMTQSVTLSRISQTPIPSSMVSPVPSNTSAPMATPTVGPFPLGNSTTYFPTATAAVLTITTVVPCDTTGPPTGPAPTGPAATPTVYPSAAAPPGVQIMRGGLLLSALGAMALLI